MGHPDLKIDTDELEPLLDAQTISDLQNKYLQTMRANFQEWMGKSLESDFKVRELLPPFSDQFSWWRILFCRLFWNV